MITTNMKSLSGLIAGTENGCEVFRELMDAIPVAIYTTDAQGRLTYFNPATAKLAGQVLEIGADERCVLSRMYLPDGRPLPYEQSPVAVLLKGGSMPSSEEYIGERPDGTRCWFTSHPAVLRDSEGKIKGGINVLVEEPGIAERKQVERGAWLLSAIVDSSDDAIISKNLNGIITSWNKSAERIFGYTAEEAIGQSVASLLIPADRQEEEPDILARLQRGERVDHFETKRRRKDGTLLDISLTISPVRDAKGTIIGASKIARNITESKRIQAALTASEANFRQLANAMPQIVWTARPDGRVDYFNERWYDFSGFAREDNGDLSWEPILHPDDLERCRQTWYSCVESGQPYSIEYRFFDRNEKRWRWFVGRALAVRDSKGEIVKWFGSCTDIDEQKTVQEELRRANRDLEQFAFSASHDLQEPLRTIKLYSELLWKRHHGSINEEAQKFLRFVHGGATRMEMLVRDLLAYTQAAKIDEASEDADANDALNSALANLASVISETRANITRDPLPAVPVHSMHLKQLFQNLVGNALKYRSADRRPVVHIGVKRQNDEWVFSVRDNGIGIDPQYKENIFGLFKRLHNSSEYAGTGIGLAICRRIVDQYHGRIWVESEVGRGATFRFSLPASMTASEARS